MTSSRLPEGGPPPPSGSAGQGDPLAAWFVDPSPAPRAAFEADLRSRVLGLPPSAGHWILRLPGRDPLYLPTLPTSLALLALGALLLTFGWLLVGTYGEEQAGETAPETAPMLDLVPAELEDASDREDEERDGQAADDQAGAEEDGRPPRSPASQEDGDATDRDAGEPNAAAGEAPGRLSTATPPPTDPPPPPASATPAPPATATAPPPPPPPASGDDDDDDDDPPTATASPLPPPATATLGLPPLPEPFPSVTPVPVRDLPTVEPPPPTAAAP